MSLLFFQIYFFTSYNTILLQDKYEGKIDSFQTNSGV